MKPAPHPVPNSAGTQPPRLPVPAAACDCHMHVFDPAMPRAAGITGTVDPDAETTPDATAAHYRLLQRRLGTVRTVVVTPRQYGVDNTVTIAAVRSLGAKSTRGVGVATPEVPDAELRALRDAGIRGLRYSIARRADVPDGGPLFARIAALAPRMRHFDMHLQLHWSPAQVIANADALLGMDCTLVMDHLARLPETGAAGKEAGAIVKRLIDSGHAWMKLSGWYLDSAAPSYAAAVAVAADFVSHAPERMVWGSDWPHASEKTKPDDAAMLDLLEQCAPSNDSRTLILVRNPQELYGFGPDQPD